MAGSALMMMTDGGVRLPPLGHLGFSGDIYVQGIRVRF
jgi:hypothetical protein